MEARMHIPSAGRYAGPRRKPGVIYSGLFRGTHWQEQTATALAYTGDCTVIIDAHGREVLSLKGTIYHGAQESPFDFTDITDPSRSFVGREKLAAMLWVNDLCDRIVVLPVR